MNKPTGKLTEAYQTIAAMEAKIAELVAASQAAMELVSIVTADRDALASAVNELQKAIIEYDDCDTASQSRQAMRQMLFIAKLTPELCLAAHDAEVGAKAVLEFAAKLLVNQKVDVIDCAKAEADQLRAKAGAE